MNILGSILSIFSRNTNQESVNTDSFWDEMIILPPRLPISKDRGEYQYTTVRRRDLTDIIRIDVRAGSNLYGDAVTLDTKKRGYDIPGAPDSVLAWLEANKVPVPPAFREIVKDYLEHKARIQGHRTDGSGGGAGANAPLSDTI